jgi:hypothetical protein
VNDHVDKAAYDQANGRHQNDFSQTDFYKMGLDPAHAAWG